MAIGVRLRFAGGTQEVALRLLPNALRGGEQIVCDKGYAGREFAPRSNPASPRRSCARAARTSRRARRPSR
jgi:hypothetical protein